MREGEKENERETKGGEPEKGNRCREEEIGKEGERKREKG